MKPVAGELAGESVTGSDVDDGAWASKPAVRNTIERRLAILCASFLLVLGANMEFSDFATKTAFSP